MIRLLIDVTLRRWPLFPLSLNEMENKEFARGEKRWTAFWRSHIIVGRSFRELNESKKPADTPTRGHRFTKRVPSTTH